MEVSSLTPHLTQIINTTQNLIQDAENLKEATHHLLRQTPSGHEPILMAVTVFILACFVGYYVIWKVTPALHSPLMAVTNAISSVIIVGALYAMNESASLITIISGFIAIVVASVNIFGGFVITQRMLAMFSKKK